MAKIQSSVTLQNLAQYSTLITDTSPTSPFYFNLSQVPDVLTSGRNAFLIAGDATSGGTKTLVAGSTIKMEILDANGNPIYLTPIPNYTEGNSWVISIEVYPGTTAVGTATLTILGQAYVDPTGTVITDPMWTDAYNVKWQTQFIVQPYAPNTTPIRFYNTPQLEVTEQLGPFRIPVTGSPTTINTGGVTGVTISPNTPNYLGVPQTILRASGFVFTTPMIGGTFSAVVSGAVFSSSIVSLYNSGTALLTSSVTNSSGLPVAFSTTNFGISFTPETTYSITAVTRSYADITLTDLNTFSGEVARTKIYALSLDQPGNWQPIADVSVEENELTVTESLTTANQELSLGRNLTPALIGQYWEFGYAEVTGTVGYGGPNLNGTPEWSASYTSQFQIDSVHLVEPNGSNFLYTNAAIPIHPYAWLGIAADLPFDPNSEYTLSCSLFCAINQTVSPARLNAYMFGPAFPTNSGQYQMVGAGPGPGSPYGYLVDSWYFQSGSGGGVVNVDTNFVALASGTARLRFVIWNGDWNIANVSIYAGTDIGYNANTINVVTPMPTNIPRFNQIQFKAELYDCNNNLVPLDIEDGPISFTGANVVLVGTDHQVQGQIAVIPSGTTIQYPLRLAATGFNVSGAFVSGSAFMLGSGNFAAADTPILIGADSGGNPYVSLGANLVAYNVPGQGFQMSISGNLVVQGTASLANISNYTNFAMLSGTSVNDGAGAASAVSRYQSYQVQNNQGVTFTTAFQVSPRIEFSKIQFYEPRAKWGTLSQVILQSGNTTAFATGSPARDNTSALNLTAVGCTVQVVIAQPGAANGTSTVFTVPLPQPPTEFGGQPGPPINTGNSAAASPLPSTSPSMQYTWGYASGSGSEGVPEDGWGITSYLQYSPDTVTWTTIDTIAYTVNGVFSITVPSAQHIIVSSIPSANGYFRVELQTNVEPNTAVVGGYYIQWGSSSVAPQYASMAILTGSDAQYVTMEVFTKS